ncbi:MAG TPA: ThiF family adenylyltransferase [Blastocatellia bacterium]|nr:ThiF family adenylyltransferase [Blastocatellia bacterium]
MNADADGAETLVIPDEDRYHRQALIPWWDQGRVAGARVLVVGAGALGNEILKLLALTGIGNTLIYDMDTIELSNLSRTVLFREADQGAPKAAVAAQRMTELNPDIKARGHQANVAFAAGLGIFLWADVVICGLDNRTARLFVNGACARTGRVWIDGATENLSGIVRVFDPARTACYECTMNELDRKLVLQRRSCARLARDAAARGQVPTTAVSASLVAALEVQEAIKVLHGQPTLLGEGIHINGLWGDFSRVRYQRRPDCPGHEFLGALAPLGRGAADVSLGELLQLAEEKFGEGAVLDLSRDVILRLNCPACHLTEACGRPVGALREHEAACPNCKVHRIVDITGSVSRDLGLDLSLTLADIGVPPFDVVVLRCGLTAQQAYLLDGDAAAVLGGLRAGFDPAIS